MSSEQSSIPVQIRPLSMASREQCGMFQELHSLPRSRLYSLVPRKIGTIWRESLTGYINRLGWTHHVAPRALVAQEVVSRLSNEQHVNPLAHFSVFGYQGAMVLNGYGVEVRLGSLQKSLTVFLCSKMPGKIGM